MKKIITVIVIITVIFMLFSCTGRDEKFREIILNEEERLEWVAKDSEVKFTIETSGKLSIDCGNEVCIVEIRLDEKLIERDYGNGYYVFYGYIEVGKYELKIEYEIDGRRYIEKVNIILDRTINFCEEQNIRALSDGEVETPDVTYSEGKISWNKTTDIEYTVYNFGEIMPIEISESNGRKIVDVYELADGEYEIYVKAYDVENYASSEKSNTINLKITSSNPFIEINNEFLEITANHEKFTSEDYKITINGKKYDGNKITLGEYKIEGIAERKEEKQIDIDRFSNEIEYKEISLNFVDGELSINNDEQIESNSIKIYKDEELIENTSNNANLESEGYEPGEYKIVVDANGKYGKYFKRKELNYTKLAKFEKPTIIYDSVNDKLTVEHNGCDKLIVKVNDDVKEITAEGISGNIEIDLNGNIGENQVRVKAIKEGYKDSDEVYLEYIKKIKTEDIANLSIDVDKAENKIRLTWDNISEGVINYEIEFVNKLNSDTVKLTCTINDCEIAIVDKFITVLDEVYDYTFTASIAETEEYYLPGESASITMKRERLDSSVVTVTGSEVSWSAVENAEKYTIKVYEEEELVYDETMVGFVKDLDGTELKKGSYTVKIIAIDNDGIYATSESEEKAAEVDRINYITAIKPEVGVGTEMSPYIVKSAEELYYMSVERNKEYRLDCDIDLAEYEWIPVGNENEPFTGKLNIGKNSENEYYRIINMTIEYATADNVGLFGCYSGGDLEKISLLNCKISGNFKNAGLLCGKVKGKVNIQDIIVSGEISGGNTEKVGGVVGEYDTINALNGSISIMRCVTNVKISFTAAQYSGGIIGYANNYMEEGGENNLQIQYNLMYGVMEDIEKSAEFKEVACGWSYSIKVSYVSTGFYGGIVMENIQAAIRDLNDTTLPIYAILQENNFVLSEEYSPIKVKLKGAA